MYNPTGDVFATTSRHAREYRTTSIIHDVKPAAVGTNGGVELIRYARLPETDREKRAREADKEGGEMIKVRRGGAAGGEGGRQITGFAINGSLDQIAGE